MGVAMANAKDGVKQALGIATASPRTSLYPHPLLPAHSYVHVHVHMRMRMHKQAADVVLEWSNADDGVARWCERLRDEGRLQPAPRRLTRLLRPMRAPQGATLALAAAFAAALAFAAAARCFRLHAS